jgi:DNA-directed RNA polymerase specialized sigma24 family protein
MKTIDPKNTTTTATTSPHGIASPPPAARTAGNDNAHTVTGNDNARECAGADATLLVVHADFVACVRGTLVRNGRRRTLENDIPEVQTRVLEAARLAPMPVDLDRWKALGRAVAKHFAIDERRKKDVRDRYDEGLCEEPDRYGPIERHRPPDPVDTKRYLGVLKELFDRGVMPPMGGEILCDAADEVPQDETAKETGLTERQVKRRLKAMRDCFSARLDELDLRDGEHTGWDKSHSKRGT